ncbi:hypothetical protein TcBrA4_0123930 [Trypanosoma cruzi]|nr:hypothetical protein TcBrA4_0123930 [Trypanosoma cruzi]
MPFADRRTKLRLQLREARRGEEKLDILRRHNEDLQSRLNDARRGQEKLDAVQRHNEELQSQLCEARRAEEALRMPAAKPGSRRGRLRICAALRSA